MEYAWTVNHGFSKSRTCGKECHDEWTWKEILSMLGKEYYPQLEKPVDSVGPGLIYCPYDMSEKLLSSSSSTNTQGK